MSLSPRMMALLLAVACVLSPKTGSAAHVRVFVLTGQSNSLGTTNGSETDPSPGGDPTDAIVRFWWHNVADASTSIGDSGGEIATLTEQQGGYYPGSAAHWGPEFGFARTLRAAGIDGLMVVKASRGGGGNTFWQKGSADDHMYQHIVATVTAATAAIVTAGDSFEIAGLLYLQGESNDPAEAAAAGTRFAELLDNLRIDLPNAGDMKAVIGGITAGGASRDTTRAQQAAIAAARPDIAYVENLDLALVADGLHLSKASKLVAGERFAEAALRIVDLGAMPRISEFMADNEGSLADEDGDFSDWIEIYNPGPSAADLGGCYLTDRMTNLTRWQIPDGEVLAPGGYRVVFASGKNRAVAAAELHTNFSLNASGESVALVAPDGSTLLSAFENFPAQRADVSYGTGGSADTMVAEDAPAKALVPADGGFGSSWQGVGFDDSAWASGTNGVGYDTGQGGGGVLPDGARASAEFDFKYEQDVGSQTQDLDNNGTSDFWASNAGELPSIANGIATFSSGDFYRTDYGNSVIRANFAANDPFTIEARLRILATGGAEGVRGTMALFYRDSDGSGAVAYGGRNETGYLTGAYQTVDANPNTDGFHVFRLAKTAAGEVWLWRDGQLLNPGGTALPESSVGTSAWGLYVGDTGSANSGDWELDYLRITPGAFAPSGGALYEELIGLDLRAEMVANASAFVRLPFDNPADPMVYGGLRLRARYDDGFVAYLNGAEIARRNAPAAVDWNSAAAGDRPDGDALESETIDVSAGALLAGPNVLVVQLLNAAPSAERAVGRFELEGVRAQLASRFYPVPTPGGANGAGVAGFVGDTSFDIDRGFYEAPFVVTIVSTTPDAAIYYTTDGSVPSAENGMHYTGPVTISTTTPLRAVATKPDFQPSNVDTQTYLFAADVLTQTGAGLPAPTNPAVSDWDYEMDPNVVGDPRYAPTLIEDLKALPTMSIVLPAEDMWGANGIQNNPTQLGMAWERACSMEMIYPGDPARNFQEDAGIRVQGAGSRFRNLGKKSFRVTFRNLYGAGKLDEPFFGPGTPRGIDNIVLRGSYFDSWTVHLPGSGAGIGWNNALQFRTDFGHQTHRDMGAPSILSNWSHVYFNGIYWGIYNTHERPDENFAALHLGGDPADYDVLKQRPRGEPNGAPPELVSGSLDKWQAFMALMGQDFSDPAVYAEALTYIDVDQFIDYLLMNFYGGNEDWPHNNWYAIRHVPSDGPFVFYNWDPENYLFDVNVNRTGVNTGNSPGIIYDRLRGNPAFRLRFADRAHRYLFNGGALTVAKNAERFQSFVSLLRGPMNAESARWGDTRTEPPLNVVDTWLPTVDDKLDNYFPQRQGIFLAQLRAANLYPAVDAPVFAQHGGVVANGYALTISAADAIYYSIDGSEPSVPYAGAIPLAGEVTVKARAQSGGGEWSALTEATFLVGAVPADAASLVLSEIHYRPADATPGEMSAGFTDRDAFEFLEIMNVGSQPVDLTGVRFAEGVLYAFPPLSVLLPGERRVLAADAAGFELRYGFAPADVYAGNLSNDGERLLLLGAGDVVIADVTYNDQLPWPVAADGDGFSLTLMNPGGSSDPAEAESWRASAASGGSPGGKDTVPFAGDPNPAALMAYAFGIGAEVSARLEGETGQLIIAFPTNPLAEGVTYGVEISENLRDWSSGLAVYLGEVGSLRSYRIPSTARVFGRVRLGLAVP